ncbi:MAG: thermonuclease family protein [Alphaproteobacteria bacterium]|nr:thermonuclease family protein [Alphaproteobacteria bacterium]
MILLLALVLGCLPSATGDEDSGADGADDGSTDGGTDGATTGSTCRLTGIDPASLPQVDGACREPELVTVTFVADGDTIIADTSQGEEKIRFIGVDTPEMGYGDDPQECWGPEAKAVTEELLADAGDCVWLTFDRGCLDPYDRTLAYLHVGVGDEGFVERRLLRGGHATVLIYDPNDAYETEFEADEAEAHAEGVGLWETCGGNF